MPDKVPTVDLLNFTFDSLFFCGTPIETMRGSRFLIAVNDWYMTFIRTGWAVPLAFVIDVSTMLLHPGTGFRNRWKENHSDEVKQVSLNYYKMLQGLRRQPICEAVVELLGSTRDEARRNQATKVFLRFLLAELSQFRDTYAFNSRSLKILSARPTAEGIPKMQLVVDGRKRQLDVQFHDPERGAGGNEFGTIADMMRALTEYYTTHRLEEFISAEEWLMVEIAARSRAGIGRVDFRFLQELLGGWELSDVEEHEPRPRMVERIIPTDSYETDGHVGGYIDVNQRKFSGSVAEILPAEIALFQNPPLMYHKLLNEGALHFVREDIECIEEELRVLFCFVIDVDDGMMRVPADIDSAFGQGMTPYVRARALASLLIMDLARFMPREKTHVDCALYLWSSRAKHIYRTEFDLLAAWSRETAHERFGFASGLVARAPHLFYNRVGREAERENIAMDRDPAQYVVRRNQTRLYHCRHMVFLTSTYTGDSVLPENDLGLVAGDHSSDSIFFICCDVNHTTFDIARPLTIYDAADQLQSRNFGRISEDRLRSQFVETVLLKGAGKVPSSESYEMLSELS